MQKTVAIAHWIVRVAGVIQLTLGALFWTGHAYTYVPVHIVVGSVLVLALWLVAVLALVARVKRGLAVFELVWGLALVWFGVQQAGFLVGGMHWIVRVVHLLMALSAMGIAGALGKALGGTRLVEAESDAAPMRRVS